MNKNRPTVSKRTSGFTLVEILVAIAMLLILITAVSSMILTSLKAVRITRDNAAAKTYAMAILDIYRAKWANEDAYMSAQTPVFTDLPTLPRSYSSTTPEVVITSVGIKDGSGILLPDLVIKGVSSPLVRRVTVTLTSDEGNAVNYYTDISNPSRRNKL